VVRARLLALVVGMNALAFACSSSDEIIQTAPPDEEPPPDDTPDAADATTPPPPKPKKDAGVDADAGPPPPPQVYPTVESAGGKVITTPKVIPITFEGDNFKTQIEDFVPRLAGSTYWTTITSEYGIGALTVLPAIRINEVPASLDDTQVQLWLQDKIANDARFGAADPNTLYSIFYPKGVGVTLAGTQSCAAFGGYHSETVAKSGIAISYSVVPHCGGGFAQFDLDLVTTAQSHETLEWATDPLPFSAPAFSKFDDAHYIWRNVLLGELGDVCFTGGNDVDVRPTELGGYAVQRTWSNKQSLLGKDPCVPYVAGYEPYFTGIPTLPDSVTFKEVFRDVTTPALQVGVGQTKTIDVRLYSDGPTSGDFTIRVVDLAQINPGEPAAQSPSGPAEFTLSLDKTSGHNGDIIHLTVTGVAPVKKGFGFVLISTLGQNVHVWPGLVYN
jgi:hypothetical protein